jgi:uncharacterized protein (TIGR02996 family)
MTHEEVFLRDICENHDDDASRLIFADWLEDQGDAEYAKFIRIQYQLTQLADDSAERILMENEERRLQRSLFANVEKSGRAWLKKVPAWAWQSEPKFERGFLTSVATTSGVFSKDAGKIFSQAPLEKLKLSPKRLRLESLTKCRGLEKLRSVDLTDAQIGEAGLRTLLELNTLTGLRHLNLMACALGPRTGAMLADSPHLTELQSLNLATNGSGEEKGIDTLARSPIFANLRELNLWANRLRACEINASVKPSDQVIPRVFWDQTWRLTIKFTSSERPHSRSYGSWDVRSAPAISGRRLERAAR